MAALAPVRVKVTRSPLPSTVIVPDVGAATVPFLISELIVKVSRLACEDALISPVIPVIVAVVRS